MNSSAALLLRRIEPERLCFQAEPLVALSQENKSFLNLNLLLLHSDICYPFTIVSRLESNLDSFFFGTGLEKNSSARCWTRTSNHRTGKPDSHAPEHLTLLPWRFKKLRSRLDPEEEVEDNNIKL